MLVVCGIQAARFDSPLNRCLPFERCTPCATPSKTKQRCRLQKDGEQRPTQRGIALAPEQWSALRAGLPQLLDAARRQDTSFDLPLGGTRRAAVSQWKGAINVHVREYYDAGGGEMKPGKKGITVSVEGLEAMHGAAAAVDAQVAKLKGGSGDSAAAAAAGSAGAATPSGSLAAAGAGGASSSQQPLAARAHPAHKASAAAPTPPASAAAAARPPLQAPTGLAPTPSFVDLGGDKRATVSTWKGRVNVDMREYYNAGGKMKPGKKGIAVPPAEWRTIAARAADISAAAQRGDQRFALQLAPGSSRRVAVSEFKGKVYVGVREFYEKDGQSLPGAKGLSMTVDQWRRLVDGIPAVDAALAAAEGGGV